MENRDMIQDNLNSDLGSPSDVMGERLGDSDIVITKRSRKSKRATKKINLDFLVTWLTIISIIGVLSYFIFVTTHTTIDLNKNEKGEISLIIDYNENNEVNVPGKTVWSMIEEGLKVLKSML